MTEFAMDRITEELRKAADDLAIVASELELLILKNEPPTRQLCEKIAVTKGRILDWITLAQNWRVIADLNNVDVDNDNA